MSRRDFENLLRIKKKIDPDDEYIGESPAILGVFQQIKFFNQNSDRPILLTGPTGCGKTAIAELIHKSSKRKGRPFWVEQGPGLRPSDTSLIYAKWVGSGRNPGVSGLPKEGSPGLLQRCAGGTIFIDEIHEASTDAQTFLYGILDHQELTPTVGQGKKFRPDVRLLFATNLDPVKAAESGIILPALFRRLCQSFIEIPSLAERREDTFLFVRRLCPGHQPTPKFLLALLRYPWQRGNVGQLKDVLWAASMSTAGKDRPLTLDHLQSKDPAFHKIVEAVRALDEDEAEREVYSVLGDMLIRQGLKKGTGLQERMAKLLGVSRATVSRRLKVFFSDPSKLVIPSSPEE